MPVNWFVNGWGKKRFARPNNTFLVALCLSSSTVVERHTMRVLYDDKTSAFQMTEGVFQQYRLLWLAHRAPSVPVYEMTSKNQADNAISFLCRFMQPPKPRKRMAKTRLENISDPYAEYRCDLNVLDSQRDEDRRASLASQDRSAGEFKRRFNEVVTWATSNRDGFAWLRNSCHLDVWLMEELALLSSLCSRDVGSLLVLGILSGPDKDMGMLRLVKVLLALGKPQQQQYKVAYWLMEIEQYKAGMKMWGYSMCTEHADMLSEHSGCRDGSVHVACTIECSNPFHEDAAVVGKKNVTCANEWYSVPAKYMRTQVGRNEEGKIIWDHDGDYGRHVHVDIEDVMQTLLARSDRRKATCKQCADQHVEPPPFLVSIKTPLLAKLPKFLRVHVNRGSTIQPEQGFQIGGWDYDLCSVVFGNTGHFQSNVLLNTVWFHYDGMGIKTGDSGQTRRLKKMDNEDEQYWLPFTEGYAPVSYTYLRFDPVNSSSLEHVAPINDIADFKVDDFQFESMHSVLDAADLVRQGGEVIDISV